MSVSEYRGSYFSIVSLRRHILCFRREPWSESDEGLASTAWLPAEEALNALMNPLPVQSRVSKAVNEDRGLAN